MKASISLFLEKERTIANSISYSLSVELFLWPSLALSWEQFRIHVSIGSGSVNTKQYRLDHELGQLWPIFKGTV